MCGICGFAGKTLLDKQVLRKMNNAMSHRGPDGDGYFMNASVGLAMKRLSIIDLEQGGQPIYNTDRSACVVFNGEIYNYIELREELEKKGYRFRTDSDTEVIIHLYDEYNEAFVNYLQGMFAIAIWDSRIKKLIIARDRLGIKPLFYYNSEDTLLFASEIKCLHATNIPEKEIDLQAMDAFFTYTYIPAPLTIYKNIFKLKPGHMLIYQDNNLKISKYWDVEFKGYYSGNFAELEYELEDIIKQSIKLHMRSDVPLGVFLSGGLDSSLVAAIMPQYNEGNSSIDTYTMGFQGQNISLLDERKNAKLVTELYGLNYNEFMVKPDIEDILEKSIDIFDEPFADDSIIPSYYVSELCSKHVKVALSGLGGDELFAGYNRYSGLGISTVYDHVPHLMKDKLFNKVINLLYEPKRGADYINHLKRFSNASTKSIDHRYLHYVSSMPAEERKTLYKLNSNDIDLNFTDNFILKSFNDYESDNPIEKAIYADLKTYLPEDILALSDRMSMRHSLELRVPFVDHKLIEFCQRIPIKHKLNLLNKKIILKKICSRYLPENIIKMKKQGFESPMASWLRHDLKQFMERVLNKKEIDETGLFNYDLVNMKINDHLNGREKNNKFLFSLIIFNMWFKKNIA